MRSPPRSLTDAKHPGEAVLRWMKALIRPDKAGQFAKGLQAQRLGPKALGLGPFFGRRHGQTERDLGSALNLTELAPCIGMFWAILTPEEHVIDALLRLNADIAVMARKDRAIGAIMSNTHSPPVRRSIRRVLQEKPSGPHQCGSVSD